MLPESVGSALPGESPVTRSICVTDILFPCTEVLLYFLSCCNKILECFSETCTEFQKNTLEVLRQPLEEHVIHLVRAMSNVTYPADFLLL